jgi:hypothetical protein
MNTKTLSLLALGLFTGCVGTEKDTAEETDTSAEEEVEDTAVEEEEEEEEEVDPGYQGAMPSGDAGCMLQGADLGVENAGLFCFEATDEWSTPIEELCGNADNASYLELVADGCPAEGIIYGCEIPAGEGGADYAGAAMGFYYEGAVGTQDACEGVGGTWVE